MKKVRNSLTWFSHVAFRFTSTGSEEIWSAHSVVAPAATASTPAAFIPHSTSIGSAQQDSRADVRLRAHLHAPPATIIPAEDDDELLDAPPDIDVPVSTAVSSALTHLEQAIDNMHSASPTPLAFDPLFYLALSSLPLTHLWPILTIDLKNFLSHGSTRPDAPGRGSGLGQSEIPTPCSRAKQLLQRPCPCRGAYNFGSSQLSAHASKSTATGFHCRVLACSFQLRRTTHGPRPCGHGVHRWPGGRSDLPVEFSGP